MRKLEEVLAKIQRFELDSGGIEYDWYLSSELAHYINRYMTTHVFEKVIKDKILAELPVSRNVKSTQKLDEYIEELLVENKKTLVLKNI